MFYDLGFPRDRRPPAYLLLLSSAINKLASQLAVKSPWKIIPIEIQKRVLAIFAHEGEYDWKYPPGITLNDIETKQEFISLYNNPQTGKPWERDSFRDHICKNLLGLTAKEIDKFRSRADRLIG